MALGFGKKKAEETAEAAPFELNSPSEGESTDFDADTFALDQFAADLEAAGSTTVFNGLETAAPSPSSAPASDDPLAWDSTSLLSFDDPGSLDPNASHPRAGARGAGETTPFDDLARELEGIPSIAGTPDFGVGAPSVTPAAPAEVPERKTRRKAVSADLKEALASGQEQEGGKKGKKPKKERSISLDEPGAKKKLPLIPIIGVGAVLILGLGGYLMFGPGATNSEQELAPQVDMGLKKEEAPTAEASKEAPKPAAEAPKPAAEAPKPAAAAPGKPPKADPARLKQLWEQGKAAKRQAKPDYEAARKAWMEILKLDPGHPGIQDAIDKLPKKKP